ncbi:hypothetical protein FRB90_011729 [Tulasnella sp. 427]|nr:hypothetical protein FRB90_011729 [Tulasnella sp. 427]
MSSATSASHRFAESGDMSIESDEETLHESSSWSSASPTSYCYQLATEMDAYFHYKAVKNGANEFMENLCSMPLYARTSPEVIFRGFFSDASEHSPALSAASLGTITRSVSPALTTSSGSTIKASRLNRSGQLTPAPSEYGTPVLTSRNLPDDPEPSSSSSKNLGKRISAMSIEDDELSTPVKNTGGGLFGGIPSSSSSSLSTIPSSPAAERHPKINTAEREWEASIRDAQRKKGLLERAQAAYDEAVALEKAMFKTYSKLRMNLDT